MLRRNSQSIGKIKRNRERRSDAGLVDMTPDRNIVESGLKSYSSKSAIKKKMLDEKYRMMLIEYETKNRELDSRMKEFEASDIKKSAQKHYPKKMMRALPILMTSDFNFDRQPKYADPIPHRPVIERPRTVKRH